jgi:GTP-binding protein LepA
LRALIFDSWFDPYRGVIILVRVIDGRLKLRQKIKLWSNGQMFDVEAVGYQSPKAIPCDELSAGEVGFLSANIKTVSMPRSATPSLTPKIRRPEPLARL